MNTTLFDYQGKLRQGPLRLFAWPVPETMVDQLNPVGTVVSNIDTVTSVSLDLEFQSYANAVVYPSFDTVITLIVTPILLNPSKLRLTLSEQRQLLRDIKFY